MVTEHCIPVDAGAVKLVVESRKLTNEIIEGAFHDVVDAEILFDDFGATLHVCGTADGVEHLRFDCSRTSRTTTTSSRRTVRTPWCGSTN